MRSPAGEFNRRIEVLEAGLSKNSYGDQEQDWDNPGVVARRWVKFEQSSGREFVTAQQQVSDMTHMLRMPFDANLGIKPHHRLRSNARIFEILAIDDVGDAHDELRILCREKV